MHSVRSNTDFVTRNWRFMMCVSSTHRLLFSKAAGPGDLAEKQGNRRRIAFTIRPMNGSLEQGKSNLDWRENTALSYCVRVEKPEDPQPALSRALAHDGPALVKVMVNRQELSMPPTISLNEASGFSLHRFRAVLSGRGDEVIDLARTNLLS
jgi:hypothetical protein